MIAADELTRTFHALADPTRRRMLASLATGEKTVGELSEPFDLSPPGITKHLKVLERAGLIERSRRAQYRPCTLRPAPLKEAAGWIEQYRAFWEGSFDRLEQYLTEIQAHRRDDDADDKNHDG
jgi:DNA-binding transcriptional ArsR family regulator